MNVVYYAVNTEMRPFARIIKASPLKSMGQSRNLKSLNLFFNFFFSFINRSQGLIPNSNFLEHNVTTNTHMLFLNVYD